MPGRTKCDPGCTCKKHRVSEKTRQKLRDSHRTRTYKKCEPGCTCGHHDRPDLKGPCPPGCTCYKHREQTEEHRRRNSEGLKRATAEGRWNTPEQHAKKAATRKANGPYQSPEAIEAMQEGRRQALAAGFIDPGGYVDGRSHHKHYACWYNMVARCTKPHHPEWRRYGGRGIVVCDEWLDPFVFYSYLEALGIKPDGYSLDRIDNDGNYEPGNIRWASVSQQNANRSPYSK